MSTTLHIGAPRRKNSVWPHPQRRNERDEPQRRRNWVRSTPAATRWPGALTALAVAFIVGGLALFGSLPL